MSIFLNDCAAAQAHRALISAGRGFLRQACSDQGRGGYVEAQLRFDLASDFLGLTHWLHKVLLGTAMLDAAEAYRELLTHASDLSRWPQVPTVAEMRAAVLLGRVSLVTWGDRAAMLVDRLPRLSAVAKRRIVIPLETRQLEAVKRGEVLP